MLPLLLCHLQTVWSLSTSIQRFFVLAVLGLEVFSVILAGYASGSKWSLFGAMREAAQVVSYEVPLGMCVVVPVMICGTMNLTTIGNMQAGLFTNGSSLMTHLHSSRRLFASLVPRLESIELRLKTAEAESELVADSIRSIQDCVGVYSSWLNTARCLLSQLWQVSCSLAAHTARFRLFKWIGETIGELGFKVFLALLEWVTFGKGLIGVTLMMWIRWSFPRLRIDQVMTMCLKYCVPLAAGLSERRLGGILICQPPIPGR